MNLSTLNSDVATMSSLEIAELCEKRHDHVIVDVEKLFDFYKEVYTPEKSGVLIKRGSYVASNGKSNKQYLLNKDAVIDLITGYSLPHRHAVNQRWQELEAKQVEMLSPAEFLLRQAQMLVDIERRQRETEAEQAKTNERVARIEAKQQAFEDGASYFTVIGYAVWRNLPSLDLKSAATIGKIATRISKEENSLVDKVKDPRFGTVNAYHESVLEKAVSEFMS